MSQLIQTLITALVAGGLLAACVDQPAVRPETGSTGGGASSADDLLIVDCLLPGQIRKLGSQMTYLSARRPIQTTAQDCEIRGGEYVAYDRANYRSALRVWLPMAEQGDPDAQNKVGEIYEKGLGGQPDYEMAKIWYRRAAEQGFTRAQINLGFLYEQGLGVEPDLKTALDWYRKGSNLPEAVLIDKAEYEASRKELEDLRRQLDGSRSELEKARRDLDRRESALRKERQRLLDTIEELKNRSTGGRMSATDRKRIADIRLELDRQSQELEEREARIKELESQSRRQQEKLLLAESEGASLKEQLSLVKKQLDRSYQDLDRYQRLAAEGTDELERARRALAEASSDAEKKDAAYRRIRELQAHLAQQERTLSEQRRALAQWQRKTVDLEQRLSRTDSSDRAEIATLQAQLSQARDELKSAKDKVGVREDELQVLQNELATQKQDQDLASARITELEDLLKSREEAVAERQEMVAALRQEADQWKEKLAQLEQKSQDTTADVPSGRAAEVPVAPPSIQLIEPLLLATRDSQMRIPIKRGLTSRNIVGQVSAPGGLYSLSLNGAKLKTDALGLFQASISLAAGETPVRLVAIDKRGNRGSLDFSLVTEDGGKLVAKKHNPLKDVEIGEFYALVIGNEAYTELPRLETARNDAEDVAKLLKERFGFKVTLLTDATRYQILSALNEFREKLIPKDSLVIYYAGHGELDRVNLRGQWLPVDAEPHSSANWISNVAITDVLNAMEARHVLVIADSCYSGTLTRSSLTNLQAGQSEETRDHWIKALTKMRSRTVLSSGGLAPVLDGGGGSHSVFAKAFLSVIRELDEVTEGQKIYREVAARVAFEADRYRVEQVPQYAPIKFAGHESGDFLFVPKQYMN